MSKGVLLKKDDYVKSLEDIFADRCKFKPAEDDNTISRVENIKRYLNTMLNRKGDFGRREKTDEDEGCQQSSS